MNKFVRVLWLAAMSLLSAVSVLSSCSRDDDMPQNDIKEMGFYFSVSVGDSKVMRSATQELQTPREKQIGELWLFIFEGSSPSSGLIYSHSCKFLTKSGEEDAYVAAFSEQDKANITRNVGPRYVVLVANHHFAGSAMPQTLGDLERTVDRQAGSVRLNGNPPFGALPMIGTTDINLKPDTRDLGSIGLERRVSKISVLQPDVDVNGYELDADNFTSAAICNYTDRGYLRFNEMPQGAGYLVSDFVTGDGTSRPFSFYTYYTSWSSRDHQLAVLLRLMLKKKNDPSPAKPYYYLARVDDRDGSMHSTAANMIYQMKTVVRRLGSTDPYNPVVLENNEVFVSPWNWTSGESVISEGSYLYLLAHQASMISETLEVGYASSSDVTAQKIEKAYYYYLDADSGDEKVITIDANHQPEMLPTAVCENGLLKIRSKTPDNYLPKEFRVTVKNKDGDMDEISINHYPPIYVRSNLNKDDPKQGKNPTYHIRVLYMPQNHMVDQFDLSTITFGIPKLYWMGFYPNIYENNMTLVGYSPFNPNPTDHPWVHITYPNKLSAGAVSPNFEIEYRKPQMEIKDSFFFGKYQRPKNSIVELGESHGINHTDPLYYPLSPKQENELHAMRIYIILNETWLRFADVKNAYSSKVVQSTPDKSYAVAYCAELSEKGSGLAENIKGVDNLPWTGWRIPTKSELDFIYALQHDPKCPVKNIINLGCYWSADAGYASNLDASVKDRKPYEDIREGIAKPRCYVRCIRDIKKEVDNW